MNASPRYLRRALRPLRALHALILAIAVWATGTSSAFAKTYTLPELIEAASSRNPGLAAGAAATSAIEAQLSEARRSWWPTGEFTSLVAPSPNMQCEADLNVFPRPTNVDEKTWREQHCYRTNYSEATLRLNGVFSRTEVKLVQPIYTFGKISAGIDAAKAGVQASRNREAGIRQDMILNIKRAYYGAKLAREIEETLQEAMDYIDEAQQRIDKELAEGTGEVSITDRLRLRTVRAEAETRVLEAKRGRDIAHGGIRALLGPEAPSEIDVDAEPLEPVAVTLRPLAAYEDEARLSRPEVKALNHLVASKRALASLEWRKQYPDLVILGTASYAYATSVDDPQNAFASDPFNSSSAGLGAALRLPLDLGVKNSRAARLKAEAEEVIQRRREALGGIAFEVSKAYAELKEAIEREKVLARAEKAGKQWITTVAQNFAAGLAETKDFSDALVAYFQYRGRHLESVHDLNLAAAALTRATGGDLSR